MNKNRISHWHLVKGVKGNMYLSHRPKGTEKKWGHPCTRESKKNSRWYCTACGIYAPREISFVADLAGCFRHTIIPK